MQRIWQGDSFPVWQVFISRSHFASQELQSIVPCSHDWNGGHDALFPIDQGILLLQKRMTQRIWSLSFVHWEHNRTRLGDNLRGLATLRVCLHKTKHTKDIILKHMVDILWNRNYRVAAAFCEFLVSVVTWGGASLGILFGAMGLRFLSGSDLCGGQRPPLGRGPHGAACKEVSVWNIGHIVISCRHVMSNHVLYFVSYKIRHCMVQQPKSTFQRTVEEMHNHTVDASVLPELVALNGIYQICACTLLHLYRCWGMVTFTAAWQVLRSQHGFGEFGARVCGSVWVCDVCVQWPIVAYPNNFVSLTARQKSKALLTHEKDNSWHKKQQFNLHHHNTNRKQWKLKLFFNWFALFTDAQTVGTFFCKVCWIWGVNPSRNKSHPQRRSNSDINSYRVCGSQCTQCTRALRNREFEMWPFLGNFGM